MAKFRLDKLNLSTKVLLALLVFVAAVGITLVVLYRQNIFAVETPDPETKTYPPTNFCIYLSGGRWATTWVKGCSITLTWDSPKDILADKGIPESNIRYAINVYRDDNGDGEFGTGSEHLPIGIGTQKTKWRSYNERYWHLNFWEDNCNKDFKVIVDTRIKEGDKWVNTSPLSRVSKVFKLDYSKISFRGHFSGYDKGPCPPKQVKANIAHWIRGSTRQDELHINWERNEDCAEKNSCGKNSYKFNGFRITVPSGEVYTCDGGGGSDQECSASKLPTHYSDTKFNNRDEGRYTIEALDSSGNRCGESYIDIPAALPAGSRICLNEEGDWEENEEDPDDPDTAGEEDYGFAECKDECVKRQQCKAGWRDPICRGLCSFSCAIMGMVAGLFNWAFGLLAEGVGLS